jgi:isoquinoline 1-oxidoreductase beta subunit
MRLLDTEADVTGVPYLAHATLEPMNATAVVRDGSCEIWAPTQGQTAAVAAAAAITGLPTSAITLHTTFLGGGLGRRIETDFVAQAVTVAMAHKGKPVKLVWSREEDFTHDYYRPSAQCRLDAGLDASGALKALDIRTVSPSIFYQRNPKVLDDSAAFDRIAVEGLYDMPYGLEHLRVEWVRDPAEVPVGFWRSVGHSHNAFFLESFLDEVAAATGRDPFAVRRDLLAGKRRHLAVLDALERHSGWADPVPAGRARGMALSDSFGSLSAQVAEVSGTPSDPVVHRITIVVDCGTTINPDTVRAQLEGGVMHGLSAALDGEMPFQDGEPRKRNFNSYKMLRMAEAPPVDVHVIESGAALGGIGEVGVPCVAPALANAFARLGGVRARTLPLETHD